jgi:hypothetical protein
LAESPLKKLRLLFKRMGPLLTQALRIRLNERLENWELPLTFAPIPHDRHGTQDGEAGMF